jgi:PHD/YefM family antitoxin component YafN of YafNO toxin-antitoxin module
MCTESRTISMAVNKNNIKHIKSQGGPMQLHVKENYIVDNKGKPVSVIIGKKDYDKLVEYIEELEDIAAYDYAKREKNAPKSWASVKR